MSRPRRIAPLLIIGLMVAACHSSPPPPPSFPPISFDNAPPIALNVAAIDVEDDYHPPFQPPNVEHEYPEPPARALADWAHTRLTAAGQQGRARFTITDASVIETELPQKSGITGVFTKDASARYDLSITAKLDILDDHGFPLHTASATVKSSRSIMEGTTLNQRDQFWYDMTKAAMIDFDHQMESGIRSNFGNAVQ